MNLNIKLKINKNIQYFKINNKEYMLVNDDYIIIKLEKNTYNLIDIESTKKVENINNLNYIIMGNKKTTPLIYNKEIFINEFFIYIYINKNVYKILRNKDEIEYSMILYQNILTYNLDVIKSNEINNYIMNKILNSIELYIDNKSNNILTIVDNQELIYENINKRLENLLESNYYKIYLNKEKTCYLINNNSYNKDELNSTIELLFKTRNDNNKYLIPINLYINKLTRSLEINILNQDYTNIKIIENKGQYKYPYMILDGEEYFYNGFFLDIIRNMESKRLYKYKVNENEKQNIITKLKYKKYPFINIEKTDKYCEIIFENDEEIKINNEYIIYI